MVSRRHSVRINESNRIVKSITIWGMSSHFVRQRINHMPPSNLRIIHPRAIVMPVKTTSITEFLILMFFSVIQVFVFGVVWLQRLTTYPHHRESKLIIMRSSRVNL
jgi:hypothetical protein